MASPAEAHRDHQAEQRQITLLSNHTRRHKMLQDIISEVGLGDRNADDFAERESAEHLHKAYNILELSIRARRSA